MSTIFRDKVSVDTGSGVLNFNDAASIGFWYPGALAVGMDQLDGWSNTAGLNVISVPRGVGDGSYTATTFPALARTLTAGGWVQTNSRAAMDATWDQMIASAFPVDTDIILTRFEPIPKYVTCRVSGEFDLTQYQPEMGAFRWEGTLLCSDPFKYDALSTLSDSTGVAGLSSGGRTYPRVYPLVYTTVGGGEGNQIELYNIGTQRADTVITIQGHIDSGWRVDNTSTGDSISFDVDLSSTDVFVIDSKARQATLNGSPLTGLIQGDWIKLQRGNNVLKLFGNYIASTSLTVTAKSTWR